MSNFSFTQLIDNLKNAGHGDLIKSQSFSVGQTVFKEGDKSDDLYLIEDGQVGIYKIADTNSGKEKELAILKTGNFFGENALFDDSARSATVRILKKSKLIIINRTNLFKILENEPKTALSLLMNILQVSNHRLQEMNRQLVLLYEIGRLSSKYKQDVNLLCGEILKRVIEASSADRAVLFLKETFSEKFVAKAAFDRACNQLGADDIKTFGEMIWKIPADEEYLNIDHHVAIPVKNLENQVIGGIILKVDEMPIAEEKIRLVLTVAEQLGNLFGAVSSYKDQKSRDKLGQKFIGW